VSLKKTTIILFPDGADKVRQYRLPNYLLIFLILLIVSCSAFFTHFLQTYIFTKTEMSLLTQLKKENETQKKQFIYLAEQIIKMNQKVEKFQDIDRRVKTVVNLKTSNNIKPLRGIGGSDQALLRPDDSTLKDYRALIRSLHRSLDDLNDEITLTKQDKFEIHEFFENQRRIFASRPSIWPAKGRLSSGFGYRISPFTGERELHRGVDIAAKKNSPVVAPADGIVSSVDRNRLSGKVLFIKHGNELRTSYAHLQKIIVKEGQFVKRGEKIALVGNSGRSTGPHLHYEVHLKGVPVNPLKYILVTE